MNRSGQSTISTPVQVSPDACVKASERSGADARLELDASLEHCKICPMTGLVRGVGSRLVYRRESGLADCHLDDDPGRRSCSVVTRL